MAPPDPAPIRGRWTDHDEAASVVKRLLAKLDELAEPFVGIREDGERVELRDWLQLNCFGSDHELYDDVHALLYSRPRPVPDEAAMLVRLSDSMTQEQMVAAFEMGDRSVVLAIAKAMLEISNGQ